MFWSEAAWPPTSSRIASNTALLSCCRQSPRWRWNQYVSVQLLPNHALYSELEAPRPVDEATRYPLGCLILFVVSCPIQFSLQPRHLRTGKYRPGCAGLGIHHGAHHATPVPDGTAKMLDPLATQLICGPMIRLREMLGGNELTCCSTTYMVSCSSRVSTK